VIRRVSRSFVPVALNLYVIRKEKSAAGDFFRAVQKQRPAQYQGIYIVSPEGKVLATQGSEPPKPKSWTQDLLDAIDDGITAHGGVAARRPDAVDLLPDRGVGRRSDGSIVLAVYTRYLLSGLDRRGFGSATLDSVVWSGTDRAQLELPDLASGDEVAAGPAGVRKLHRVLSPSSDANTMPRADELTRYRLTGRVERVRDGIAYLSFRGSIAGIHTVEFDPNKGKKIHAEMAFTGVGACDAKTGKLLAITLLGDGQYKSYGPGDRPMRYGAVVEWRLKR
jgi:hypothetical protein